MPFVQSLYEELKQLRKIRDEGLIREDDHTQAYETIIRKFNDEGKNIRDFTTDEHPVTSNTGPAVETICTRTPIGKRGKRGTDCINDGGTVDNRAKMAKSRRNNKEVAEQVRKR